MADRRDERDMPGMGGMNNPLLDDLLLSAAAAAASGSSQPNLGNLPGATPQQQQQQQQYQAWSSSFDHLSLPSAYSGWYGQPGMGFGSGADLLGGTFPNYDDLLSATVNQGASSDDSLIHNTGFGAEQVPHTSAPNSSGMPSSGMPNNGMPSSSGMPTSSGMPSNGMPSSSGMPISSGMPNSAFLASQQGMGMEYSPPDHTSNFGSNNFQFGEHPLGGASADNGSPFQQAATDGRNMYTDALSRWGMYQGSIYSPFDTDVFPEPKPVDPSPWENPAFSNASPINHSDIIKSPPPPIPTPQDTREALSAENSMPEVSAQSVQNLADQIMETISATSNSTCSESVCSSSPPQQSATVAPSSVNSRPSYSDVAKHAKTSGNVPKQQQAQSQKSSSDWLPVESLPPEFPSVPINVKPPQRQKSKSSRHSHKSKSDSEPTLKPDSKYGLDMFEDVSRERVRTHNSECSTPQSRKSSASSITSASSGGIEELRHAVQGNGSAQPKVQSPVESAPNPKVNAYDATEVVGVVGSKYDIRKGDLKNHHKFSQGTQAHAQESRAGSASPHVSAQPKHKKANTDSAKSNQTQSKVFFDPKRIFQAQSSSSKSSSKSSGAEKSSIPNNQQPLAGNRREQPDVLLNNGKPSASLFTGGNVGKPSNTTYINNDLRQHKKQTNTEERNSPHRSTTESFTNEPRRGGARQKQDHSTAEAHTGHHQGPLRSSSAGRRKRGDTSTAPSRKQTAVPEDRPKRSRKQKDEGPNPLNILYEWAWAAWVWMKWGVLELFYVIYNIAVILFKLCVIVVLLIVQYVVVLGGKVWSFLQRKIPFFRRFQPSSSWSGSNQRKYGLEENITLPTTGDEAMRRLLACKGKDPYSILGVRSDASDEDIKKYYRKQAVLVHPDKNQQPGAEESFKILGASFEIIGEPERRRKFDSQRVQTQEMEADMKQFSDLLTKLQEKVQEAANMMRCENCGGKHRRFPVDRAWYDARFCDKCNTRHSAKEGDVWAESRVLGFLWHYYACMEGKVYDITEWASCQKNHFKHMQANAHQVIYRIATNANKRGKGQGGSEELEDFLNQLFHHAARSDAPGAAGGGAGASSGASSPGAESAGWDRDNPSGSGWSRAGAGPSPPPGGAAAAGMGKRRKKKRKH